MNRQIIVKELQPTNKRTLLISDIHGNLKAYKSLLKKAEYDPKKDRLLLLGDLMEKGTDSFDLLQYVMKQCKEEDVHCLMGNCDFVAKNVLFSYRLEFLRSVLLARKNSLIHQMAKRIGMEPLNTFTNMSDYCHELRQHFLKELCFLNDLPHVMFDDKHIFTHAGLVSEDDFGPDMRFAMTMPYFLKSRQKFKKQVFCGHMPVSEYDNEIACFDVKYNGKNNIYSLDGGNMVNVAGQLNCLILDKNDIHSISVDDFEKAEALVSTHPGNPAPFYLSFQNAHVDVLKKEDRQSYVKAEGIERSFWIENEFLQQVKDGYIATGYTNYEMPLNEGETVSIVRTYQDKVQIKKNSRLGWTYKKNLKKL